MPSDSWLPLGAAAAVGVAAGAGGALLICALRRRHKCLRDAVVYELNGQHYQELGHAWDHETKEFKVVYRPLYHCEAKRGSFEAHVLATSHFSRWEEKFKRVHAAEVPVEVSQWLLPGPFVFDPEWAYAWRTGPLLARSKATRSGHPNRRSHQPPRLEDFIGDYRAFIDAVDSELRTRGIDALARGYEMDHICFRCGSVAEYIQVLSALVPTFGTTLEECMIGGRPIAIVQLHEPILHGGYRVACLEVPCPKEGRAYESGLEHAEVVVGVPSDPVTGNERLLAFMEDCKTDHRVTLSLSEDASLQKRINPDIKHELTLADGRQAVVKFHARPLYEVCAWEREHGEGVPVPQGYFGDQRA